MANKKDLIAMFKAETEDHLTNLEKGIVELEKHPEKVEIVKELNREAHTIKGSAKIFGFQEISQVAHVVEDIFGKIGQDEIVFSNKIADSIFKGLDAIREILTQIATEEKVKMDVDAVCEALEGCINEDVPGGTGENEEKTEQKEAEKKGKITLFKKKTEPEEENEEEEEKETRKIKRPKMGGTIEEYIRLPLGRVNKLLNLVGEMVINKMKSSQKISQARELSRLCKDSQKELTALGEIIKTKYSLKDADVAKALSSCSAVLQKTKETSLVLYDNISTEAFHLDPVIDELQAKMKEIRMLPCATIFEGFPRMIRDIAAQEKKKVNLKMTGGETELDKKVLEGIKDPLMHIMRNCVDHGIEDPEVRKKKGKPRAGTIKLSAWHEAGNVVITAEDDGKGIDPEEIKNIVLKKGLLTKQELDTMTEKEIINLIFMNGFSSSQMITDISGRGIGLDVVRCDIEKLKGQVVLDTIKEKGTKISLILPLTVAIIQVLLVKQQGLLFAFPMRGIAEASKTDLKKAATIEGRMAIQVRDRTIPVVRLSEVLGLPETLKEETPKNIETEKNKEMPVIIASILDKQIGFIVDEIVGKEEAFIKTLGEHLGKVKNVSGATILGTGEVVVILDVADLIAQSRLGHPAAVKRKKTTKQQKIMKKLLIVEDALSTRELEKSILEAQGYNVDTAVDGLDALDKLAQGRYDLVVSDVNMPRMDGFELCSTIKRSDQYKDIPVVMVTALDKEEDKRSGIEAGAQAYIVKTAFDQRNLIDAIERLIG